MKFVFGCVMTLAVLLAGCNSLGRHSDNILAIPIQPRFEEEVMLIRIEQILATASLSDEDRVSLLFERGRLYDQLGLYVLARNDFSQALAIRPNIPQIFGFLGKYLTQEGNFDTAFEAYDSALELEPTNMAAYFDRGIALYYSARYAMAQDDLLKFYQSYPQNPFGVLWLYIVDREIDAKQAMKNLQQRYDSTQDKKDWGWLVVEFYLGKLGRSSLLDKLRDKATDNTSLAEFLSETYFYLGKYYLSLGDVNSAVSLFKLTIANNAYTSDGHRYALLELVLLKQRQNSLSESRRD